jgi:hypothetical protein
VKLAAVLALAATTLTAQTQAPNISGRWTYNAAQSDNPRGLLQAGDSGEAPEGGRGGRRGGGGYPGGIGGGRGGATGGGYGGEFGGREGVPRRPDLTDQQRQRLRQTMRLVFEAPRALALTQTDSTVGFATDTGAVFLVPSNGRKVKQEAVHDGDGDVTIKGRWQGNDFVVERAVSGGGKVNEDYLLSSDGKQLFVIVNFDSGRGRAVTFRRIYDLVQ